MPDTPDITLVIPVYNRAGIVGRTLRSVAAQTHRPLRVILVDNNSTDNTLEVLTQWKLQTEALGFTVDILSETEPGAAAARNRGLDAVTGEYVMFFDSDDTMEPDHVARAMEAFRSPRHPDIVGWDIRIHPLSGKCFTVPFYTSDTIWHCIMHGSMGTQRYAARTSLFRDAGGWNTRSMGWNDIEIGTRLLLNRPVMQKLRGITVEVNRETESITGTDFSHSPRKWESTLDFMEQTLPDRRRKRYLQLKRAILAGDYAREAAHSQARRLMAAVTASEPCPFYRTLYRLAFRYVAAGHRGAARLLRPFF